MSGIYIHIPFCKKACHYCDFHFSTNLKSINALEKALVREIKLRNTYLGSDPIKTIYFGGGTPSILSARSLTNILIQIQHEFKVDENVEITLEANPDDLSIEKLIELKDLGIDRLSVGIQTFNDEKLQYINRSHTAREAMDCLANIQKVGFSSVSADLIFAIPPHDLSLLSQDLETLISYGLPHISVYGLTIEEKTVFGKWVKKGQLQPIEENNNLEQYQLVIESLKSAGYEHYEVSNFAQPGQYSKHNTAYWNGTPYIGFGPGAHSYDVESRSYNISNNQGYIKSLSQDELPITTELLSLIDRRNEYMMTRIRTQWGVDLNAYENLFGSSFLNLNERFISEIIDHGQALIVGNHFYLTQKGWYLADEISARLFLEE